jgi:ABC-2 type transport system permease protein
VELLDPSSVNPGLRYLVALGFGLIFFMAALTFGSTIAQSVVEEKQTRVVELLISAYPVQALLAGKVIGNTILAMGQIIGLAAIAIVGFTVTGRAVCSPGSAPPSPGSPSSSSSASSCSPHCSPRPRRWCRGWRTSARRRRR